MNALIINKSDSSPAIQFSAGASEFFIAGESAPENARTVYFPVLEWLEEYKNKADKSE